MKRFGLAASEEKSFENVDNDGRRLTTTHGRPLDHYTISSPVRGELKMADVEEAPWFSASFYVVNVIFKNFK